MKHGIYVLFICICLSTLASCSNSYARSERNVQLAEEYYQKAVLLLPCEDEEMRAEAKALLTLAIEADLYHGAAHNNLGVLLLQEQELYQAAQEFEWARKLLPGNPDPRVNLSIALQRGGHVEEALSACDSALEIRPHYVAAMQSKAYIALRHDLEVPGIQEYLKVIALRGESPAWRRWAAMQRIKMNN